MYIYICVCELCEYLYREIERVYRKKGVDHSFGTPQHAMIRLTTHPQGFYAKAFVREKRPQMFVEFQRLTFLITVKSV